MHLFYSQTYIWTGEKFSRHDHESLVQPNSLSLKRHNIRWKISYPLIEFWSFSGPRKCAENIRYSLLTSCSLHLCFWSIFCTRRRRVLKVYGLCSVWNHMICGVKNLGFLLIFWQYVETRYCWNLWRLQNFLFLIMWHPGPIQVFSKKLVSIICPLTFFFFFLGGCQDEKLPTSPKKKIKKGQKKKK
jgi:hypothetical protein